MQHIQDNTEQNKKDTENNNTQEQPQHNCSTYDLHKYSFDFIV